AVIAIRKPSVRMKASSGDIFLSSLPICRPCESRDPYAAAYRLKMRCSTAFAPHERRWLWVPAFAGTTRCSHPLHRHRDLRAVPDGLIDHAIAFGELEQQVELVLRRIGLDVEAQADLGKTDRRFL